MKKISKFRIVNIKQNINPDISVTSLKKDSKRGNMYNVFREDIDVDMGAYSEPVMISHGFTKEQLRKVRKSGTTNFVGSMKK